MKPFALAAIVAVTTALVGIAAPLHAEDAHPATRSAAAPANAAPSSPTGDRTFVHADLVGRVNPEGGSAIVGLTHVRALDDRAESDWRHGTFAVDGSLMVTPASFQASASAVWTPVQIVPVRVQLDYFGYFGTFGGGLSFDAKDADFGADVLRDRADEGEASHAFRAMIEPTVRAKVGPVVLRSQTRVAYYHFSATGPYVYEPEYDTLLENDDLLVDNQSSILFEAWSGAAHETLLLGPSYQLTYAVGADLARHRLGATMYFQPTEALGPFDRPHVLVNAGVNVADANRAGQPFAILAVGADFDL